MIKNPLPRLDKAPELRQKLLPHCRLQPGQIWRDPVSGHAVGCLDATAAAQVALLCGDERANLAIHDPPYNLVAFEERRLLEYIAWCKQWIELTRLYLK